MLAWKVWSKALKNLDSQNKQGAQKGKHLRNQRWHICLQEISQMKGNLPVSVSEVN